MPKDVWLKGKNAIAFLRPFLTGLLALALVLGHGGLAMAADFGRGEVTLVTASGQRYHFEVEVAHSPALQAQGLMFRKSLAQNKGMVFPYDPAQEVSMWMENTYISLDMLFVGEGGRIIKIHPEARPGSRKIISSGAKVEAVIELKGKTARRLGVRVGDRVELRYF